MTEIEKKALALVNEVCDGRAEHFSGHIRRTNSIHEALCRAIEAHEAFRQEVSDAVEGYNPNSGVSPKTYFARFIQPKTDPLVAALREVLGREGDDLTELADRVRCFAKERGIEIREVWKIQEVGK